MAEPPARQRVQRFVGELRRRKVVRVVLAYLIAGVGVAQGARIFFPALGLPPWTVGFVAVLVVLGFPIAVVLAWAFDVTPEGVVKTGEVHSLPETHEKVPSTDRPAGQVAPLADEVLVVEERPDASDLEQYELLERLGDGGMGVVFKARDTRLDRIVALKFLSPHLSTNEDAKKRFLIEAQAAAALDHPNTCAIHEVGETPQGRPFIAMTFCDGDTLKARLQEGPLELEEALDIALQTCRGLEAAARREIVHRDIKPGNLMLTGDGTVKIVDFGLARISDGGLTRTGAQMGTVAYMSPEQAAGDPVDVRTDIWSLGVVLYEMIAGVRPFKGANDPATVHSILTDTPSQLGDLAPGLPHSVEKVVERMLSKRQDDRYADPGAVSTDLASLLSDPTILAPTDAEPTLSPEGERRSITVLGCSVAGYESLLDTLDPEEVDAAMDALQESVRAVVEEYGGVLNEFSEDKIAALFGVPVAHEDDALRAVRAALALRDLPPSREEIRLRFAVGAGQVAIRTAGAGDRRYRVGGSVVSDVLRLATFAAPGDVLTRPEVARAVEAHVEMEVRDPITISPDAPPLRPTAVLAELVRTDGFEASAPEELTQFVGRVVELEALQRAMDSASRMTGRLVTVVGDAGVGKSRLNYEFRRSLATAGVRYVGGRCQSHGAQKHYLPFIDCLNTMFRLDADQATRAEQIVAAARELAPELETYIPFFLHLLGTESDEHPLPDYLSGEELRGALGEALVGIFTLGSREEPLVVFLDNWHWADGGSKEVLGQLAGMVATHALLIVVTARPDPGGASVPLRGDVHLDLEPLEPTAAAEVVRASLGAENLPRELADHVSEKTGGNPFFIEEVCRTLLEAGTVEIVDGEARVDAPMIAELEIPDTVQAVLRTRLDRLDPGSREVLRSASVIGREFGLSLLSQIVPDADLVGPALEVLQTTGLIQPTGVVPEPTYRFKHALTLDVTYESLLGRQRRERHALAAEAIEVLHTDQLDEQAEVLAHHFAAAENWERAVDFGFAAAQRAASLWQVPEAQETLDRVREWIERKDDEPSERRAQLIRLLLDLERHLETLGQRDRQQASIDELLELVEEQGDEHSKAQALVRQGELLTFRARHEEAAAAFQRAIEIATELDDIDVRARALRGIAHSLWRRGHHQEALPYLEEVVEINKSRPPHGNVVPDLLNLGRNVTHLGDHDRALEVGEEAWAYAESGTIVDRGYVLNYRGHLYLSMGRKDEALAFFEQAVSISREFFMPLNGSFNELAIAAVYIERGDVELALEAYRNAVALARRSHRPDNLAHALTLMGDALVPLAKYDDAVPAYAEAAEMHERVGNLEELAQALSKLAAVQEAAGLPIAAATWTRTVETNRQIGDRAAMLEALEREAGLQLRLQNEDGAGALFKHAIKIASELDDPASEARSKNSFAILAWRAGDLDQAEAHYRDAQSLLAGREDGEELGVVLNGLGAVLTRIGKHEEAIEVLKRARDLNGRTGAQGAQADSLSALGAAYRESGDLTRSYDTYQLCAEVRRDSGDRAGEGWALQRLAEVSMGAGATERAAGFLSAVLEISEEVGDPELAQRCATKQAELARNGLESEEKGDV